MEMVVALERRGGGLTHTVKLHALQLKLKTYNLSLEGQL